MILWHQAQQAPAEKVSAEVLEVGAHASDLGVARVARVPQQHLHAVEQSSHLQRTVLVQPLGACECHHLVAELLHACDDLGAVRALRGHGCRELVCWRVDGQAGRVWDVHFL